MVWHTSSDTSLTTVWDTPTYANTYYVTDSTGSRLQIVPDSIQASYSAPEPEPEAEDDLAWLRRRVDEITELVAA